jgi:hypothetical protein
MMSNNFSWGSFQAQKKNLHVYSYRQRAAPFDRAMAGTDSNSFTRRKRILRISVNDQKNNPMIRKRKDLWYSLFFLFAGGLLIRPSFSFSAGAAIMLLAGIACLLAAMVIFWLISVNECGHHPGNCGSSIHTGCTQTNRTASCYYLAAVKIQC